MNRLDPVLNHRVVRRRASALYRVLVLPVVLALVPVVAALPMTLLPTTSVEADIILACEDLPEEPTSNIARPRVAAAGKDLNGGVLVPGDEILWTVTVKNLGDTLTGIVVADVVPEWTSYVESSIDGLGADDSANPKLTWVVGTLKCGERVTVSFRSRVDDGVPAGTLITNQASADSAQTPPGSSQAVTLEVSGSSESSKTESSASSTPTVAGLELATGGDSSAQTPGGSEAEDAAALGSPEAGSSSSESASSLEDSADDELSPTTAAASDDGEGWKLGVGLGAGLGGLALFGSGAGLATWWHRRTAGH